MSTPSLRLLPTPRPPSRVIRFDPFVLDVRTGELRKHGVRIRLRQQTFQILQMLLENHGEVVLRDQIRERLWPDNTVVEFDHSINAAIQKLRDALGESADKPRRIETLKGRGYRFLGTVEVVTTEPASDAPPREAHLAIPVVPALALEIGAIAATHPTRARILSIAAAIGCSMAAGAWWRPWELLDPARNWTLSLGAIELPIVSPDGSAVVYRKAGGLWLRRMNTVGEIRVYGAHPAIDVPAWSPDGSQIVFPTLDGLIKMQVPNGLPSTIAPVSGPTRGLSWGSKGDILVAMNNAGLGGLDLVPAAGGNPVRLEVPGLPYGRFYQPEFLPNGEDILFGWAAEGDDEAGIYLATVKQAKVVRGPVLLRKNITPGHFSAADGNLLFVQDNNLYAQRMNIRNGKLEGEPQRLIEGVFSVSGVRSAYFSVSRNGVLAWRGGSAALAQLTWFDREGKAIATAGPPCDASRVVLSRDEKHLLLSTGNNRTIVVDTRNGGTVPLPGLLGVRWLPDSLRIIYFDRRKRSGIQLLERAVAGGPAREVVRLPGSAAPLDVSPDGKILLYRSAQWSLYSVRIDAPEVEPRLVVETKENIMNARFSPDGRWIVYAAGDRDKSQVYVHPFTSSGIRTQISSLGGRGPVWRRDGKEILYRHGKTIYSVRVEARGNQIHASAPKSLFEVRNPAGLVGASEPLDVTRDGSRILFAQAIVQPEAQMTYAMTAWDSLLKR